MKKVYYLSFWLITFLTLSLPSSAQKLLGISEGSIYEINKETAETTLLESNIGVSKVSGLTYDRNAGRVYGISNFNTTPTLFYFSPCNYEVHIVGELQSNKVENPTDINFAEGIAFSESDRKIYVSIGEATPYSRVLGTVNPQTAEVTEIGEFSNGFDNESDALTFIKGELYSLDGGGNLSEAERFYITDVTDATTSYVNTPTPRVNSVKQSNDGTIYGSSTRTGKLYTIESDLSASIEIGYLNTNGSEPINSIVFVEDTVQLEGKLIGLAGSHILDVNPDDGSAEKIGNLNFSTPSGMAYATHNQKLYVLNRVSQQEPGDYTFILNELDKCLNSREIGALQFSNDGIVYQAEGLAYDYINNKMYATAGSNHYWYSETFCEVDLATGELTPLTTISNNVQNESDDLEFANGLFYFADNTVELDGGFYSLENGTFNINEIKQPIQPQYQSYAYNAQDDIFYGVSDRMLYTVDRATGNGNFVGNMYGSTEYDENIVQDLEYIGNYGTITAIAPQTNDLNKKANLFPNPASDNIFVNSDFQVEEYSVIDLTGRVVKSGVANNTNSLSIKTGDLVSGSYVLILKNQNLNESFNFVVK